LEILLGVKSMQGNVTCAFLHTNLEKKNTLICQWGSPSIVRMARKSALSSKRHSTGFVKVLERSGNTSQPNSKNAGWSNQNLIPAYSLEQMSYV
jgi:hypothetical protein